LKQAIRTLATMIAAMAVTSAVSAQALRQIVFQVYDADSGEPLAASVSVDGNKIDGGRLTLAQDQESTIAIQVQTTAGASYRPRTFNVFLANFTGTQAIQKIYLAPRGAEGRVYSRGNVARATSYRGQDVDRAVALLERIYEESPSDLHGTQFGVYLRYNLAAALFGNCTEKFVDSCDAAKTMFEELLAEFDDRRAMFEAERIGKNNLTTSDFDGQTLINRYRRAKWDLSRGRYESARDAFQELLSEAEGDARVSTQLKVRVGQLKSDVDLAETRLQSARTAPP